MNRYLLGLTLCAFATAPLEASDRLAVPAGPFAMGCSMDDDACEADEGPPDGVQIQVPGFRIDRHEVSVAEYRACIQAGHCSRPKDHNRNRYCNFAAEGREAHPVNCVDWQQAEDYCAWLGGRLPWEAEWEKAARAGSASRYPWGEEVTCAQAILDDGETYGSVPNEPDGCGEDRSWPRGSRPANPWRL